MKSDFQTIEIHVLAPEKPALGKACNGCGVCCAAEPCPVSLALLWTQQKPCSALTWHKTKQRYYCGLLLKPSAHIKWLPKIAEPLAIKVFKRWIAANQGCDSDIAWISDAEYYD